MAFSIVFEEEVIEGTVLEYDEGMVMGNEVDTVVVTGVVAEVDDQLHGVCSDSWNELAKEDEETDSLVPATTCVDVAETDECGCGTVEGCTVEDCSGDLDGGIKVTEVLSPAMLLED